MVGLLREEVILMKVGKTLIILLVAFLVSCSNEDLISMEKLLKGEFASLSMKKTGTSMNSNKVLNDDSKIKHFQSLISAIPLDKIDQNDFRNIDEKIRNSGATSISWELLTSEKPGMNGLTFTLLEGGQLMVIEIEENIGVGFYKGTETSPELFMTIQDFYDSNVHNKEIEKVDF